MRKLLFSALFISLLQIGFSQMGSKARLDSFFEALQQNNKWMGSVAVVKAGKLVYSKSIGFKDADSKALADNNTKYRIGSISKTFTTVLVFKAIEEGKLSLTQTLNKYFPAIRNADKITIGQMLSHHSGIHSFTNDSTYLTYYTQPHTENEMVAIIIKGGSDFEPGSKAAYSNSNFVLLAYILQSIYKKPYGTLLLEQITKPLGLENTFFGGKINKENGESCSYKWDGNHWVKEAETDMSVPMGAGAVVSTPTDLTRFADALFTGKLISAKSLEQMKTMKDSYGMGLFQIPFNNKLSYGHTGGIDGFSSVFSYFPDDSIAYALTSNGSNFDNNDISIAVFSWIYGKPFSIPNFKTYAVTAADLDQYLGIYANPTFPLKITVTKEGNKLITQATGQSAFEVVPAAKDVFEFTKAGIVLTFQPAEKQMILKQGGRTTVFTKE